MNEHPQMPATAAGCRERLAVLGDELASIRIQIATADLRRQALRRGIDPLWFEQAKTELRMKQREAAQITAHLQTLAPGRTRADFKDALIEVVRSNCDDLAWAQLMTQARALHRAREAGHG